MDKIYFRDFKLAARIGVYPKEKAAPQNILINLEFNTDARKAAASDELNDATDYNAIKNLITEVINAKHYNLVETLAEEIAKKILEQFHITMLTLRIEKLAIYSDMKGVGVCISRYQAEK